MLAQYHLLSTPIDWCILCAWSTVNSDSGMTDPELNHFTMEAWILRSTNIPSPLFIYVMYSNDLDKLLLRSLGCNLLSTLFRFPPG